MATNVRGTVKGRVRTRMPMTKKLRLIEKTMMPKAKRIWTMMLMMLLSPRLNLRKRTQT